MKRLATILTTLLLLVPAAAFAFSVAPPVIDLAGARGSMASASVKVTNTDDHDKAFYLQAVKFVAREDSDAPRFISRDEDHSGLPDWLSFVGKVNVKAGETLEVPVKVAVPADALPGTQQAAIVVSDAPYDVVAAQGAPISARVAVLLFFTVDGGTAKAALLDFLPEDRSAVRADGMTSFAARIQNQGNVAAAPQGTVMLTDMLGRTVGSVPFNGEGSRIIPGQTRTFTGTVAATSFAIGPVTATLKATYAADAPAIVSAFSFFLLPVRAVAACGMVALLVLAALVARVMKRRA